MPNETVNAPVRRAVAALIYAAVVLCLLEYVFLPLRAQHWLSGSRIFPNTVSLAAGTVWASACFIGFLAIPFLIVKFWHREPASSIGYNISGFKSHVRVYLWLYLAMTPVIFAASQIPSFQSIYPFVAEAKSSLPKFLIWELVYVLQFIALEAFFRGYLLFTMEKVTHGYVAMAVTVVPYAMIHFHKPMAETFGAIIAGLVLSWLALRYRSWAGGALIHALVAVTMDTLACARAGLF